MKCEVKNVRLKRNVKHFRLKAKVKSVRLKRNVGEREERRGDR